MENEHDYWNMECEKLILVRSTNSVMQRGALREGDGLRFDNFTRATCILYIDLVETLNFQI